MCAVLGAHERLCSADLTVTVEPSLCDSIEQLRAKLNRYPLSQLLFLDEVAVRINETATYTIVLPHEEPIVVASDTTSYAKRFDMIACCSGTKVFAPVIYSPQERSDAGVKGINTDALLRYIHSTLAQEIAALDRYPVFLVLDRARIHNPQRILEAFHELDGSVKEVVLMPPQAAERMSPLDNALFHDWKEGIRKHTPITVTNCQQIMSDEWNKLSPDLLTVHYRRCGLTRFHQRYSDCPAPAVHQH